MRFGRGFERGAWERMKAYEVWDKEEEKEMKEHFAMEVRRYIYISLPVTGGRDNVAHLWLLDIGSSRVERMFSFCFGLVRIDWNR